MFSYPACNLANSLSHRSLWRQKKRSFPRERSEYGDRMSGNWKRSFAPESTSEKRRYIHREGDRCIQKKNDLAASRLGNPRNKLINSTDREQSERLPYDEEGSEKNSRKN